MHLTLSDNENGVQLSIPIKPEMVDVLRIQWGRFGAPETEAPWAQRLRAGLEPALAQALDWDLRPPTKAQVDYAVAIAKALKVNLPGEALLFSGAMQDVMARYVPQFKRKRGKLQQG